MLSIAVKRRYVVVCSLMSGALLVVLVGALALGEHQISLPRVLAAVLGKGSPAEDLIVEQIRLPRVLTGALVGVALGTAGAIFQSVTRNPLGSPDVIGFDFGAATGALIVILYGSAGMIATSLGAIAGGALTAIAVFLLSARGGVDPLRLVLVGIGAGSLLVAVNWMLIVRANVYDAQSAAVWLVGNLAGRGWTRVELLLPVVVVGLVLALLLTRGLAIGELSDDRATSLGLRPVQLRIAAIGVGILLASGAVASAGPVAFIALTAPQVARRVTRSSGPNLISAGLMGALLLVVTDWLGREAFQPRQIAVGVLTGVVGGLYLAWLLTREWKKGFA